MSQVELDEAALLLRKAREDAAALEKLAPDDGIADSVVGFHAQQAAEKALKAVLASLGSDFPWTHDLRYLIELVEASDAALPVQLNAIPVLAPWAVEFRYGETIEDPLDRKQARVLVAGVVAWAGDRLLAAAKAGQRTPASDAGSHEQASES